MKQQQAPFAETLTTAVGPGRVGVAARFTLRPGWGE